MQRRRKQPISGQPGIYGVSRQKRGGLPEGIPPDRFTDLAKLTRHRGTQIQKKGKPPMAKAPVIPVQKYTAWARRATVPLEVKAEVHRALVEERHLLTPGFVEKLLEAAKQSALSKRVAGYDALRRWVSTDLFEAGYLVPLTQKRPEHLLDRHGRKPKVSPSPNIRVLAERRDAPEFLEKLKAENPGQHKRIIMLLSDLSVLDRMFKAERIEKKPRPIEI